MTLIELMITVAIVALLASVALPAYQGSVRKARRTEAKAALTVASQRMERFFTENGRYDTATLGTAATDTVSPNTESGYYRIVSLGVTAGNRTTYTLTAAPQGPQAQDPCKSFTLDQNGTRGLNGSSLSVQDCW
jgi:type IV pilus assembly protein PilE